MPHSKRRKRSHERILAEQSVLVVPVMARRSVSETGRERSTRLADRKASPDLGPILVLASDRCRLRENAGESAAQGKRGTSSPRELD